MCVWRLEEEEEAARSGNADVGEYLVGESVHVVITQRLLHVAQEARRVRLAQMPVGHISARTAENVNL